MAKEPGWTRTPNAILEAMPDMTKAELKLTAVLIRATYGYHKESVRMTYDEMVTATELSRGGLSNAIDAVVSRGFFKRGNKSMWYTNSLTSELKSIDESLTNRLKSTEQTEEIVQPIDQNSLTNRPNYTGLKEKENNIYIPPLPRPVAQMVTALSVASKTPLTPKYEKDFEDGAYYLIGRDFVPEQVENFPNYWREKGWGGASGKPTLEIVLQEMDNCVKGIDTRRKGTNGNGKTSEPANMLEGV